MLCRPNNHRGCIQKVRRNLLRKFLAGVEQINSQHGAQGSRCSEAPPGCGPGTRSLPSSLRARPLRALHVLVFAVAADGASAIGGARPPPWPASCQCQYSESLIWAPQLGGRLLFLDKNKRLGGRQRPAPPGRHQGAVPVLVCDLSSETSSSASTRSRGDDVASPVCSSLTLLHVEVITCTPGLSAQGGRTLLATNGVLASLSVFSVQDLLFVLRDRCAVLAEAS